MELLILLQPEMPHTRDLKSYLCRIGRPQNDLAQFLLGPSKIEDADLLSLYTRHLTEGKLHFGQKMERVSFLLEKERRDELTAVRKRLGNFLRNFK